MKKKIAIIGTSPIMSILARELSQKNDVTIFEKIKNLVVLGRYQNIKIVFFFR